MHTAANQPSDPTNFTPPKNAEEALARIKEIYRAKRLESEVTMVAAQTKVLETLMACMTPIRSTGDTKLDNFYARERNRQRLAAIQTLLHIRTVQREKRMRRTLSAKAKAKPSNTRGAMVGAEGPGHADTGSTVATPAPSPQRGRRWSCADSAQDRMRGRSEASDHTESRDHAQTSLSTPPEYPPPRKRSRYKTRKPKRPKQPARRKR
ncbi:MAG: hypothetical protein NXI14_09435 [bacterium]|nr:hypothetical protein [bacterium]